MAIIVDSMADEEVSIELLNCIPIIAHSSGVFFDSPCAPILARTHTETFLS